MTDWFLSEWRRVLVGLEGASRAMSAKAACATNLLKNLQFTSGLIELDG